MRRNLSPGYSYIGSGGGVNYFRDTGVRGSSNSTWWSPFSGTCCVCGQVPSYLIRDMFQEIYRVHTTDVRFSVLAAKKLKGE